MKCHAYRRREFAITCFAAVFPLSVPLDSCQSLGAWPFTAVVFGPCHACAIQPDRLFIHAGIPADSANPPLVGDVDTWLLANI